MTRPGIRLARLGLLSVLMVSGMSPLLAQPTVAADSVLPERGINLDTPASPRTGDGSVLLDVRSFGSVESNTSGTLQLGYGVRDNLEVVLRGVLAAKKDFTGAGFTIRHGGTDIELMAKMRPPKSPNWAGTLGLSYPQTTAPSQTFVTTQLLYERPVGRIVTIQFAPKGVFGGSRSLVGIGGGARVRLGGSLELVGDITGIVSGNNTNSVLTGATTRSEVWALGLRYRPAKAKREFCVDLAVTNGLGGTTAMSMTPGLSGSAAVMLGVIYGFHEER